MAIDIVLDCPLDKECEYVADDKKLHRCRAYVEMAGTNPNTGEMTTQWKCSIFEWQPILLLEIAGTNRGQTEAICSMREESMKRQDAALAIATRNIKTLESL
jgi:hypothetical protein